MHCRCIYRECSSCIYRECSTIADAVNVIEQYEGILGSSPIHSSVRAVDDVYRSNKMSWSSAHSKLVSQAQRALFAIKAYQKPFGYFSAIDSFKIFDSMVKPILCYASQIWDYEYVDTI